MKLRGGRLFARPAGALWLGWFLLEDIMREEMPETGIEEWAERGRKEAATLNKEAAIIEAEAVAKSVETIGKSL